VAQWHSPNTNHYKQRLKHCVTTNKIVAHQWHKNTINDTKEQYMNELKYLNVNPEVKEQVRINISPRALNIATNVQKQTGKNLSSVIETAILQSKSTATMDEQMNEISKAFGASDNDSTTNE